MPAIESGDIGIELNDEQIRKNIDAVNRRIEEREREIEEARTRSGRANRSAIGLRREVEGGSVDGAGGKAASDNNRPVLPREKPATSRAAALPEGAVSGARRSGGKRALPAADTPIGGAATGLLPKVPKDFEDHVKTVIETDPDIVERIVSGRYGRKGVETIGGLMTDPAGFIGGKLGGALKAIGAVGAGIAIAQVVVSVIKDQQKAGGLLDVFFKDSVNTRLDAYVDRETTSQIRAGFQQAIIPLGGGFGGAAHIYNSYEADYARRHERRELWDIRYPGAP